MGLHPFAHFPAGSIRPNPPPTPINASATDRCRRRRLHCHPPKRRFDFCLIHMGISEKMDDPTTKWRVFVRENPIKMDDLRGEKLLASTFSINFWHLRTPIWFLFQVRLPTAMYFKSVSVQPNPSFRGLAIQLIAGRWQSQWLKTK